MGLQRELPGGTVLELAYIGNHAVHLLLNRNMDALPAKYLSTSPVRDQATIDYLVGARAESVRRPDSHQRQPERLDHLPRNRC